MDKELRSTDKTEPVTADEVRSLVERLSERETMIHDQATVGDVAEALQVEPSVVESILVEMRQAAGGHELREKAGQRESTDIYQTDGSKTSQVGPVFLFDDGRTVRMALVAALCFLTVITIVEGFQREPKWWLGIVPIVFALIALSRFWRSRE
jgi:hypothetical protein